MLPSESPVAPNIMRPIHLALDFDLTLTSTDTLSTLAGTAYSHPNPSIPPWTHFTRAYMEDLQNHAPPRESPNIPSPLLPTSNATLASFIHHQRSLRPVEVASLKRIRGSRIFQPVRHEELRQHAADAIENESVSFRAGWYDLLRAVMERNASSSTRAIAVDGDRPSKLSCCVEIISVNFSREWICACLKADLCRRQVDASSILEGLAVYANEVIVASQSGDETASDPVAVKMRGAQLPVHTSDDKLVRFNASRAEFAESFRQSSDEPLSVFVGDSATDIECLLAADVGICIRDEPMRSGQRELMDVFKSAGVEVSRVGDCEHESRQGGREGRVLFWVRDFVELVKWLDHR